MSQRFFAPRACILAIGTELTSGQVINSNAAWISKELEMLGVEVVWHLTVGDSSDQILGALEFCSQTAPLLFVTGGLGPTSDDLTRSLIARWTKKDLNFQEPVWNRIHSRLTGFGIKVAESNKIQAYFPEGALILPNPSGTADGFALQAMDCGIWVLPGPPHEAKATWSHSAPESGIRSVSEQIRSLITPSEGKTLHLWQCMGESESLLAERVEECLTGSGLQVGYRAHRPFVEVKVWVPSSKTLMSAPYLSRLETLLAPWFFARHEDEYLLKLLDLVTGFDEILIIDQATQGLLFEKFRKSQAQVTNAGLGNRITWSIYGQTHSESAAVAPSLHPSGKPGYLTLRISPFTAEFGWTLEAKGVDSKGTPLHFSRPCKSPWSGEKLIPRTQSAAAEIAIKSWVQSLSS